MRIRARGSPERTLVCPLEDTGLLEPSLQRRTGVAVRPNRVVTEMVGAPFRRGLIPQESGKDQVSHDQVVDQVTHGPLGAGSWR